MTARASVLTRPWMVFALALVCCFLWGSAAPAIKIGYEMFGIPSSGTASILVFAGVRFLLAGAMVVLFQSALQKRFLRPSAAALPAVFSLSLAQTAVQYLFFYVGLAHTSGVHGTILSGMGGLLSILAAALVFGYERLTPAKLAGCAAGFAGIVVMNLSGQGGAVFAASLQGEGFVLLSQISYAISGGLVKKYSARFDVVMLSGWQFMLGGAILLFAGLAAGGRMALDVPPAGWALLAYMGMISAVAYTLWGVLLKYNPVSRVAIFQFLTPLFGVLLSAVLLGEWQQALSRKTLAALALVCAGIWLVNRPHPQPKMK